MLFLVKVHECWMFSKFFILKACRLLKVPCTISEFFITRFCGPFLDNLCMWRQLHCCTFASRRLSNSFELLQFCDVTFSSHILTWFPRFWLVKGPHTTGYKQAFRTGWYQIVNQLLFPLPEIGMIIIYVSEVYNALLSQNKLKHIFWKSFKMNKDSNNLMLIHVKEKEQTVHANYVVILSMQNTHPYFESVVSWVPANFSQEIRWKQSRKMLLFSLVWQI